MFRKSRFSTFSKKGNLLQGAHLCSSNTEAYLNKKIVRLSISLVDIWIHNMPYIMVMGSLSSAHLSKDEGATVYGLKSEERTALVRELNSAFGMTIAVNSEQERTVRVTQKGLTLMVVNRLHGLLGYDVVSHAMAMTNANRELVSFTLYKKTNPHGHSHGHPHPHSSSHTTHGSHATQHGSHATQHGSHKSLSHGGVVTL